MHYFFNRVIRPCILQNKYKYICEIGASEGIHSDKLLQIKSIALAVIDLCLEADLPAMYKDNKRVKVFKGFSLEVLPKISKKFDCILIDGDHNWYTVFNELKTIHERNLIRSGGTIFLHDVSWPYGRRDLYYLPESIPRKFRHPHSKKAAVYGKSELSEDPGYYSHLTNGILVNHAMFEGGPRNGVLTAVEDFLKEHKKEYMFSYFKEECGLGLLVKK